MVFPSTEREEYANNPLREVICQLRFPPILKIGTTTPADFQDRIRNHFPLYESQSQALPLPDQLNEMLSNIGLQDLLAPNMPIVHRFLSAEKNQIVSLQPDSIALTEKDYHRWTDFRDIFWMVEQEFRTLYVPHSYSRVGLRYQNVISKQFLGFETETWVIY